VSLGVYDVAGRLVKTLLEADVAAGEHQVRWNGQDGSGCKVSAGMYFCTIEGLGVHASRRITFMP
jgi:flagellar hook assembly protein FlgD